MATARAASITRSRSYSDTSRSRTATMPWELRLLMWLPAMPTVTLWTSQPAISSASSTARWIELTVDSILTTTPRFKPRDGCEPTPTISMVPCGVISPTRHTTLEVPISSATIMLPAISPLTCIILSCSCAPANGHAIGISNVNLLYLLSLVSQTKPVDVQKAPQPGDQLLPTGHNTDAVIQLQSPGTTGFQRQTDQPQPIIGEHPVQIMKLLHDAYRFMGRAVQSWQYAVFRLQFGPENIALMIQQPLVAPARNRHLFFKLNLQRRRPLPSDAGTVYPGVTDQLILNLLQVQLQQRTAQASGQCLCQCRFVQVARGTRHADLGDRLIEPVPEFTQGRAADADKHYQQREQYNGTPITIQPLWRLLIGYTPAHRPTPARLPYAGFQPPTD